MSCQGSSRGKSVSLNLVKLERGGPLSIACLLSQVSFPNHLSIAFPAPGDTKPQQPPVKPERAAYIRPGSLGAGWKRSLVCHPCALCPVQCVGLHSPCISIQD